PKHHMRNWAPVTSANVDEVAGLQRRSPALEVARQFDRANPQSLVPSFDRRVSARLFFNARRKLDAETLVVDEAREVAAIDSFAIMPHATVFPRPMARRIPVR